MYSVSEISEICGVSTVAIYKKLKKIEGIKRFIIKENNKTMVMEEGFELIKGSLQVSKPLIKSEIAVSSMENVKSDDSKEELKELIKFLKEQLTVKDAQLTVKDEQIAERDRQIESLHSLIESANKLTENTQVLLKEEQAKSPKLLAEEVLKEHQEQLDKKLDDLKERMNERASGEVKKHWWNKKRSE